jgi:tRNA modification GTPase
MNHGLNDTIAAIATPPGQGGLCVIRISGPDALLLSDKIFSGRTRPSRCLSHTVHHGYILDVHTRERIDEALLTVFRAPGSYTCEDTVEISGHGGFQQSGRVLDSTLRAGARLAQPGEFTKRAFLNGRLDLAQAEAVADLIGARTAACARIATRQLHGAFSSTITGLIDRLVQLIGLIEVGFDFTEEDIEELDSAHLLDQTRALCRDIALVIDQSSGSHVFRDGLRCAIVGRPNVGKSSLLNALVNRNRAIVDSAPGTTRDTIEETVDLMGIPVTLIDTAGLRKSLDPVENKGVSRSYSEIEDCDLLLWVLDRSVPFTSEDETLFTRLPLNKTLCVLNKTDLEDRLLFSSRFAEPDFRVIAVSATSGLGLDELKRQILSFISGKDDISSSDILLNSRHRDHLTRCSRHLDIALNLFVEGQSGELSVLELKQAHGQLCALLGKNVEDDILDYIFSRFCIGK